MHAENRLVLTWRSFIVLVSHLTSFNRNSSCFRVKIALICVNCSLFSYKIGGAATRNAKVKGTKPTMSAMAKCYMLPRQVCSNKPLVYRT